MKTAKQMRDRQIRRIVVVHAQQKVCGIVSLADIAVETSDEKLSGRVLEESVEAFAPGPQARP